jgi:hypothetical protein
MLHLALPPTPPVIAITLQSETLVEKVWNEKQQTLLKKLKGKSSEEDVGNAELATTQPEVVNTNNASLAIANLTKPQGFAPEFSTGEAAETDISTSSSKPNLEIDVIANTPLEEKPGEQLAENSTSIAVDTPMAVDKPVMGTKSTNDSKPTENNNSNIVTPVTPGTSNITQNIKANDGNFLVGVIINNREVGTLDIRIDGNSILIPLQEFSEIAGFSIELIEDSLQLRTPLGLANLVTNDLKVIDDTIYINDAKLQEKLSTSINFNSSNLALIVDLPWRRGSNAPRQAAAELQPEFLPPSSALSNLRQELQVTNYAGNTRLRSSTLLGGRLAGGNWRVRLNNNFVNQPDVSEYFFYKRENQFRYQLGRQQIGLHPLLNGMNLTGAQFGYSNLPVDRFAQQYNAAELLPRRSRPLQTFQGEVPPASFVQLRVSGIIIAQQQVGLNGIYEFIDVNLPSGNNNEIELLVYDRNNINIPIEIRSLRLNASDLLLPAGGNVQIGGLGLSGNLVQNSLFGDFGSEAGSLVGFYQLRQGLSENLTFEGSVQSIPGTVQTQAGFIWRMANPAVLATSVGMSRGQLGYTTDLDINLGQLEILGNSQLFPSGYNSTRQSRDRFNHSLEARYRFSKNFNVGVIARSRQDESRSADYILPTFAFNPFSGLSMRGRPDLDGRYLFSTLYVPNRSMRFGFNTFGDIYTSDFTYRLNREYQVSLGGEFGGDLAARYSTTLNYNSRNFNGLSWRLGAAFSDGQVGPIAGASMQLLPGLFGRLEYQGIPSRSSNVLGGFGNERLTVLLVSDLSFAGGGVAPARSYGLGKERGAISGKIEVAGGKRGFDLGGAHVRVIDNRNNRVGAARTDSAGNFFVGNLKEGVYIVELDPDRLPIELSLNRTSLVAEVAGAAITNLNFPVSEEYGLAGRITDVTGQPMAQVLVELINPDGARVSSTVTDQFGLYRLDRVPVGNYTLRVPSQDGITNSVNLPNLQVAINKDFIYDQNLQLPIAAAAKDIIKD